MQTDFIWHNLKVWNSKIRRPPVYFYFQWHEVSVSLSNGFSVHAQRSCNTNSPIVDNWLRTPFIDVKDAKRLYIKVTYTMAKCGKVLDPASLQRCKETFKLYYYQGNNITSVFGLRRDKTCLRGFANNKGADQSAHPRRLISAFVIRLLERIISKLATSEISIF